MNAHLHHIINQQRTAELKRAAERARLASDASSQRRNARDSGAVTLRGERSRRARPRDMTGLEVERAGRGAR
jgi:hypothetical protein